MLQTSGKQAPVFSQALTIHLRNHLSSMTKPQQTRRGVHCCHCNHIRVVRVP